MLDALVRYSLNNRLAAFLLATIIACFGYYAYSHLTVEAFPDPTRVEADPDGDPHGIARQDFDLDFEIRKGSSPVDPLQFLNGA